MPQIGTASQATLNGQEYFRLFQNLQSSGDVFELDTSVRAIAVGPQSDVARCCITYFDPQAPSSLRLVEVSLNNPFVGRIDALLSTLVAGTGLSPQPGVSAQQSPARMLVSISDLIDNEYVPYDLGGNPLILRPPVEFDLYSYFSEPSNLAPVRGDKTFLFSNLARPVFNTDFVILVPYYGRRFARVIMTNQSGIATPFSFAVRGVRLGVGKTVGATNTSAEVPLGQRILAANGYADLETRASQDGQFDLLAVIVTTDEFLSDRNVRIDVSDSED